jgi:hypothetical protein
MYITELKRTNELLETANKIQFPSDFKTKYKNTAVYEKFPWEKIFNKIIIAELKSRFSKNKSYKDSDFVIVKDMYDIYWYDEKGARNFIFSIDVKNDMLNWTKRFEIFASISNIQNFLMDSGEYITFIDNDFDVQLTNSISIMSIIIESPNTTFTAKPLGDMSGNEDFQNFYAIKNTLYLMDPFLTTGKDMIITNEMKNNFQLKLNEIELLRDEERSKAGTCYTIDNVQNNNSKEDCINSGNFWDYPPNNPNDCPYFSANQNYPNNFGGLDGDKCTLPKNMKLIGYRNYSADPQYAPVCYNCNPNITSKMLGEGTLGFCCDDQKDNTKYPRLQSPDYAYQDDQEMRNKYFDSFSMLGLNIN